MVIALRWCTVDWSGHMLPEGRVAPVERVQLRLPRDMQNAWLQDAYGKGEGLWLETGRGRHAAGTPAFCTHVACLLRDCGLMANLSLRENLLLPFLYHGDERALAAAEDRLQEVAGMLQLEALLDARAGERSGLVHVLVGLGRCLLQRPAIIIAQEIHARVPVERMQWFQGVWDGVLARLDAGLVYLCSGDHPDWGLTFDRSLALATAAKERSV